MPRPSSHKRGTGLSCWLLSLVVLGIVAWGRPETASAGATRPNPSLPGAFPPAQATKDPDATIQFEHLAAADGLQGAVYWITQDHLGFLWIGTSEGLARYDGHNVKVYRHDPNDPDSLSEDHVFNILEDRQRNLWIATYGGGLERLDRDRGRFIHYQFDPADPQSLSHNKVFTLFEDRSGVLWVGTSGGGLDRYDPEIDGFVHYRHDPGDAGSLADDYVNIVYQDRADTLWIGTTNGLDRLDPQTGEFVHYQHDADDPGSLSSNMVFAILQDHLGNLWIGTSGGGLNRLETDQGRFVHYRHDPADPDSLSDDVVFCLLEDGSGTLWVASLGSGLHRFDRERGRFVRYRTDPNDPHSLSSDSINALFEDQEGTLWIGTTAGLDKYARQKQKFDRFLDYEFTQVVFEDHQGAVWIGTTRGLYQLDSSLQEVRVFEHDPDDPTSLGQGWVMSLYEDREGALWVGTSIGGLGRLDRETGQFVRYHHRSDDASSLSNDFVNVIFQDSQGRMWIGTDGGLNEFDPGQGTFRLLPTDPDRPETARVESIVEIVEDRQGMLWISSWGDGLKRLDPATGEFVTYRHDPNNAASLKSNFVSAICQDASGRLWIGTDNGLHLFQPAENNFLFYGQEQGLPADEVNAIVKGPEGKLWIGLGMELSRLDPEAGTFANFQVKRGVHGGSYWNIAWQQSNGDMLFGGADGLVAFDPRQIRQNPYVPPVALVSLNQDGQEIELDQALENAQAVTLSWRHSDFAFEFAALSFSQPEQNQHAYRLEGYDTAWNYIGTSRTGRYTSLPGGTYTLQLKGSNDDGVWNESGTSLRITIVPPFWATWWFQILAVLVVLAVIVGGYRLRVRSVESHSRELQQQVASRTRELAALNTISTVVSRSLDLDKILADALDKTLEVMGHEAGGIYLLQEQDTLLKIAVHRGLNPQLVAAIDNLAKGEGFSGRVVENGKPLLVHDLQADARLTRPLVAEHGFHSLAIAPLVSRAQVLGSLFVMSRSETRFSPQDVELLTSIGGQIGVAIENARFLQAEQRRAEQFRVITEVGRQITSILDIDELLVQVSRLIQEAFGYDHVGIALIEGDEVVYKMGAGKLWDDPGFAFKPARLKVGVEGITGWVAGSGEPALLRDVSQDPRYVWMQGSKTRSELTVPIKAKGNIVGVLDVQSEQGNAFDESDLAMLQSLANQTAVAIENASLFDAEQRRAEQFRVISEVGSRTTSILTVDDLLGQMATLIQQAFGYYHVGIGLIEGDEVVSKAEIGRLAHVYRNARIKVRQQGIWGLVAYSGEPLLVSDVRLEPRFHQAPEAADVRSHICVPLKAKDAVIGVLSAASDRVAAFDESDLVVLQSLAHQAAIALENAQLYEQAQQLAVIEERQRLARELHDAVTQTLFSASLIAEALPTLWESDQNEGRQLLWELRQLSRGALAEMRTLLLELRPAALADANLGDLLRQLGETVTGRTGTPVTVSIELDQPLPPDVHVAFYRIAQEALNNVIKHASAQTVTVSLGSVAPAAHQGDGREGAVALRVCDDGRGFCPKTVPPDRLGLGIIRERAQAIGATLQIESSPGQGTRIRVVWQRASSP